MRDFRLGVLFCSQGVFALAFFYALSVGLLIQLVMLPFVMPALDAGHGLLKGGDWLGFHQEAVQLANRIHHEGWAVWELRPQGNAPIGIAAAAYALTGISEPWVLMPLNASLFAVGATCLYMMFTLIASRQLAFAASMPYVIFPSAAVIFGQIHKDVWSIAGITLIALVWVRIAAYSNLNWKDTGIQAMLTLIGALFVWLVRPYMLQLLLFASVLTVFVIALEWFSHSDKKSFTIHGFIRIALPLILLIVFVKLPLATSVQEVGLSTKKREVTQEIVISKEKETETWQIIWQRVQLLPAFVDNLLSKFVSKLAEDRQGFTKGYTSAGSNIDTEEEFHSASDVGHYIPRATQIALFAPFPHMWRESGSSPGAGYMRLISGIEMAFTYLLLPGVVLLFLCRGPHAPATVILIQAIVPAIIIALVVSNVGTLYRMRFLNLQMLNGLGVIGWVMWLQHWNTKYRRIPD